jgi:hypothetical protein
MKIVEGRNDEVGTAAWGKTIRRAVARMPKKIPLQQAPARVRAALLAHSPECKIVEVHVRGTGRAYCPADGDGFPMVRSGI